MTTTPRNRPRVDEMRAAYEASTKGVWDTDEDGVSISMGQFKTASVCTGMGSDRIDDRYYQATADAKFIATAHNIMPSLLDYIKQLEAFTQNVIDRANDAQVDYDKHTTVATQCDSFRLAYNMLMTLNLQAKALGATVTPPPSQPDVSVGDVK